MSWFKKKKKNKIKDKTVPNENIRDESKENWIPTNETESKPSLWVDTTIAKKKFNSYQTPAVDEAIIRNVEDIIEVEVKKAPPVSYPDNVPRKKLKRPTEDKCPNCGDILYNTKLDGLYFYCSKCKRQYHI